MSYEIFKSRDAILIRDETGVSITLSFKDAAALKRDPVMPRAKNNVSEAGREVHRAQGRKIGAWTKPRAIA